MESRDTLRRHPIFVFLTVALILWLFLGGLRILPLMDWSTVHEGFIGKTARSGWIGLLVILTSLALLVVFYAELSSDSEPYQRFPPEDNR